MARRAVDHEFEVSGAVGEIEQVVHVEFGLEFVCQNHRIFWSKALNHVSVVFVVKLVAAWRATGSYAADVGNVVRAHFFMVDLNSERDYSAKRDSEALALTINR